MTLNVSRRRCGCCGKELTTTLENQTPISWSSSSLPMRCTVILLPVIHDTPSLAITSVVSQMVAMALPAPVLKMKLRNSTLDTQDGSSSALTTVFFVKHIFFGPISVAKLEASSNVLVAGCAKCVYTSTNELGGRDFVLKLPKPYCSS